MTEKELGEYRRIKDEIADLNERIEETKKCEVVQFGTVKGSSKYFPFTPKSFHVSGIDPTDISKKQEEITDLLREREVQRDELIKQQRKIENYISTINDSTTRLIFRLYFFDGLNQIEIGHKTGYDQSMISRKIKNHIKMHKMHKEM